MSGQELTEIGGASLQLYRADIDQQVATAKAYPRNIAQVESEIAAMVLESEEVAAECIYAIPRDGKVIMGPSIRMAEIVASCWGNSDYATRIIDETDRFVVAEAVMRDHQKNNRFRVEVSRRIVGSNGQRYGIDMIGVTMQAAMSIALRNAIWKGVPKRVWGGPYAKALALVAGTIETVEAKRTAAIAAFEKLGVTKAQVLALLHREMLSQIEPEDILTLRGTLQAIRDGDTTINGVFGNAARQQAPKAELGNKLDEGKANGKAKNAKAEQDGAQSQGASPQGSGNGPADGGGAGSDGSEDRADAGGNDGGGASGGGDGAVSGNGGGENAGDDDRAVSGGEAGTDAPPAIETIELPPELKAFLDAEWNPSELALLTDLAKALAAAKTSVQVSKASADFAEKFETASTELERAFSKMVSAATKLTRKKPAAGSAASKL